MRLAPVLLLVSITAVAQEISLLPIAGGLEMPVAVTHAGDARLFITQQRGVVVIHDGSALLATPFLDIRSTVLCCGERGLLSIAFHPRYRENGFFFVYYTDLNGDIVIARYKVSADPNRADESSGTILLTIEHRTYANHNGGQLAFGPDGHLYAGTGDGGGGGDPLGNAQNLQSLLGKLLRLDVDGAALPEIRAYGLRNPWRFSFDRLTGDLFIGDVGQGSWEEIDLQPAASSGGENYGWPIMEGTHCYNATTCNQSGLTLPILEYGHTAGACSVTGGARYRGARFPRLQGHYIYGDFCNGMIWGATPGANGVWTPVPLLDAPFPISAFGEDVDGEMYVADYNGRVLQIEDARTLMYPATIDAHAATPTSIAINWPAVAGAASYEIVRSADAVTFTSAGTTSATSFTDNGVQGNRSYLYKVRALSGGTTGPFSVVDLATTVVFTDEPLAAGATVVKAAHLDELRAAVNAVRQLASLTPFSFIDPALLMTTVRAVHVAELRSALAEARSALRLAPQSYTDSALAGMPIKAVHLSELRAGVR